MLGIFDEEENADITLLYETICENGIPETR